MSGRFYSDLLSGVDGRLGINNAKDHEVKTDPSYAYLHPSSGDPFVDSSYSFKTSPKKGVDMEVSKTQEAKWKGTARSVDEKTAAKLKVKGDDCVTDLSFCNDKQTFAIKGKAFDCADYDNAAQLKAEVKQAKGEWKVNGLFDIRTPDFSGATFWLNFDIQHEHDKSFLIRQKTNINYENEYSFGWHLEHDTKDFTKKRVQLVCSPKDNDSTFFLRADLARQFAGAGCDNKLKDGIRHSWEGLYSWRPGFESHGLGGQPVKLLGGVAYDLGDTSKLTVQGELGKEYVLRAGATHKLDRNWTFGVNQRFDSSKLEGANPYDIGFSMTYKL